MRFFCHCYFLRRVIVINSNDIYRAGMKRYSTKPPSRDILCRCIMMQNSVCCFFSNRFDSGDFGTCWPKKLHILYRIEFWSMLFFPGVLQLISISARQSYAITKRHTCPIRHLFIFLSLSFVTLVNEENLSSYTGGVGAMREFMQPQPACAAHHRVWRTSDVAVRSPQEPDWADGATKTQLPCPISFG